MTAKELLELYPKATQQFYTWVAEQLKQDQEKIAGQIEGVSTTHPEEASPEIVQLYGEAMIDHNVRRLYEFFDEHSIYILLEYSPGKKPWNYSVIQLLHAFRGDAYDNRIIAELEAFKEAFKLLNDKT